METCTFGYEGESQKFIASRSGRQSDSPTDAPTRSQTTGRIGGRLLCGDSEPARCRHPDLVAQLTFQIIDRILQQSPGNLSPTRAAILPVVSEPGCGRSSLWGISAISPCRSMVRASRRGGSCFDSTW